MESLKKQVGGTHYKDMKMQPIMLIVGAKCDYIQGNIIKYVSRYKQKDGKKDLLKIIQYAQMINTIVMQDQDFRIVE